MSKPSLKIQQRAASDPDPPVRTPEEIECLRHSARILSQCLDYLVSECVPGVRATEIDKKAEEYIRDHGGSPLFKGYRHAMGGGPFPATICFSPEHIVVHGVPSENWVVKENQVITIDCGISYRGWAADAARLFVVPPGDDDRHSFVAAAKRALKAGIDACRPGNRLGDISHAIQIEIARSPYFNIVEFCGHFIGRQLHEPPLIPNYGKPSTGPELKPGMVFCLEPVIRKDRPSWRMRKEGSLVQASDMWTVATADRSLAAHVEHMVLVTEDCPEVLSASLDEADCGA